MRSEIEPDREPFTTIDDCIELAEKLTAQLSRLGEQKYPLDVRRGVVQKARKGVKSVADQENSKTVKAGGKTYFFDVKQTKEGKPYLVITESRFKGEGKERERASIAVFSEHGRDFLEATQEMVEKLG